MTEEIEDALSQYGPNHHAYANTAIRRFPLTAEEIHTSKFVVDYPNSITIQEAGTYSFNGEVNFLEVGMVIPICNIIALD